MTTHSSILAWRIPWTEESGGLQSIGSQRVRHEQNDLARTHTDRHTHTYTHGEGWVEFGCVIRRPSQHAWQTDSTDKHWLKCKKKLG